MKEMIEQYDKNYLLIERRIAELAEVLYSPDCKLKNLERQRMWARIKTLERELHEIDVTVGEMKKHL